MPTPKSDKYDENSHLVEFYYTGHLDDLSKLKKRHWLLRHYLWFGDRLSKELLDEMRGVYVGSTDSRTQSIFRKIYNKSLCRPLKIKTFIKYRKDVYTHYPKLDSIERVMFHALMGGSVFNTNLRSYVKNLVPTEEVSRIRGRLLANPYHLAMISTNCINFLYISEWCYGLKPVNPLLYLTTVCKEYKSKDINHVRLQMYLLTHCIIGESKFYTKAIKKNLKVYKQMMRRLEQLLKANYKKISLDIKLEMLMCANLCGYSCKLKNKILNEAQQSLSKDGDFLVDTLNSHKKRSAKKISGAEHRNILYLMAVHKPQKKLLKR